MTFMSWRKDYEVGVPQIDAEHRNLFDLVNEYHERHIGGDTPNEIGQVLNRLVVYAERHFQHEEQQMGENGFPLLERHRELHSALVMSIFAINERLAIDRSKASAETLQFIKNWLLEHILKHDMEFADFLRRKAGHEIKPAKSETGDAPGEPGPPGPSNARKSP